MSEQLQTLEHDDTTPTSKITATIVVIRNPIFRLRSTNIRCIHLIVIHRVHRSIRGECYVKRGVYVSKRLICEHGKFICICSNKGTESDQIISSQNQDIITVYEAVIKVDIYGVGLANTRAQL
jgi:hypothetical protein